MKQNQYYNKHTMNLKQLSRDLERSIKIGKVRMCNEKKYKKNRKGKNVQ